MNESEQLIYEVVSEFVTNDSEAQKLSRRAIRACNNYIKCNSIQDPYGFILSSRIDNLCNKLNRDTITKIINNELRMKDLILTDIYDIDESLKNMKIHLTNKLAPANASSCNLYRCPRCKAKDHTYREVQKRAIDEPSSIKCVCNVCGMRFCIG